MKNLNNAYKEVLEKKDVFYNLNHDYQPSLLEIMDFELVDQLDWFQADEYEFRRELANFVIGNAEPLSRRGCYLGIHCKHENLFSFSIDEEITTLDDFLNNLDYEQLRQDKLGLLKSDITDDMGVIELIDRIQDLACMRGIRPEKDIYLYNEEETNG